MCGLSLALADLAVQHTLSTEFVRATVEARLGSTIQAKLGGGTLFTAAYVARHTARVRGVLTALTKPISLPALCKAHGEAATLVYKDFDRSMNQSIYRSIFLSVDLSVYLSLSACMSTYPSIHPYTHPCIHLYTHLNADVYMHI